MIGILLFEGTTANLADASLPGSFYGPHTFFKVFSVERSVSESSVDRIRYVPKLHTYMYG